MMKLLLLMVVLFIGANFSTWLYYSVALPIVLSSSYASAANKDGF